MFIFLIPLKNLVINFMLKYAKNHYHIYIEIIFLFLISLIPLFWFDPNHVILGRDSGYPIDYSGYFQQRLFTWLSSQNFGTDITSWLGQIPLLGLQALVSSIGVKLVDVQKITMVFWFFAISTSMYIFIRYLFSDRKYWLIRIVAVLVYILNFHLYSFAVQGSQTTFSVYALLPLVPLVFIKLMRRELSPLKAAVYINIAFFIFNAGGVLGVPLLGSVGIVTAALVIYFCIFLYAEEGLKRLKRLLLFGFWSGLIFIPLNAYWLLPFLMFFKQQFGATVQSAGGIDAAVGWAKFVSEYTSFTRLSRLQGDHDWYNHPNFYSNAFIDNPILIIASFVFPLLAYSAYFFIRKNEEKKIVLLFMFVSIIAFFFSLGAHAPFGGLYVWLMEKVPGFVAFRSPYYKFVPALYLSFAILSSISLYYILDRIKLIKLRHFISTMCIFLLIGYSYPFFQKENLAFEKPFSSMVKVPEYVLNFMKNQKASSSDGRILVVPQLNNNFPIFAYNWSYWSLQPIFHGLTDKGFVYNSVGSLTKNEELHVSSLYEALRERDYKSFTEMSQKLNIEYILLTLDTVNNYKTAPTEDPEVYKKVLDKSGFLTRAWQDGKWIIYKVKNANYEKISAISSVALLKGDVHDVNKKVMTGSQSFVNDEDFQVNINNVSIAAKIPKTNNVFSYKCISCYFFSDELHLNLIPSVSLPSSLLYPLKIARESLYLSKISDKNALVETNLQYSLKRVSEINKLRDFEPGSISEADWMVSINLLKSNWRYVDEALQKDYKNLNNTEQLIRTYQYVDFEQEKLGDLYKSLNLADGTLLKRSLSDAMWSIGRVRSELDGELERHDWQSSFMFNISNSEDKSRDLLIVKNTLPKDLDGNIILPSFYEVDGVARQIDPIEGEIDIVIPSVVSRSSRLTLGYSSLPNLVDDLKQKDIKFPDRIENCLYGNIKEYSWASTYWIGGRILPGIEKANIYIKKESSVDDITSQENGYFTSDAKFNLSNRKRQFRFKFSGSQNDTGARIYFCVDEGKIAKEVYTATSVIKAYRPQLYSQDALSIKNSRLPKISYKRISPTEYRVSVQGARDPYILDFKERFSNLWKIYLSDKRQELKGNHFRLNDYSNGWYITEQGTYDMEISFYPQKFFYIGVYVSLVSLLSLLIYIIFVRIKKNV